MLLADCCFNATHESFNDDLDQVFLDAMKSGVKYFFTPTSQETEIDNLLSMCDQRDDLYAGIGIHPHHASELRPQTRQNLMSKKNAKIRAIGEIGLDYFRNFQSHDVQKKCFEEQLDIAKEMKLPAFLHHRDAFKDFFPILKPYALELPQSIVHCFTGTKEELTAFLDLGLFIGITGWINDPQRGEDVKKLLKYIPDDRLLVETDAPYLLPKNIQVKPKNRRNEPKYLIEVIKLIAETKGQNLESLAISTTENFRKLFNC